MFLVYRNAINFCILILYPSTLLNSCISFNRFFCVCRYEFLRIFYMKNPSSANRDDFTSSFPLWMPLISFSLLVALSKTSCTMMNRNGENRHSCLVSDLKSFQSFTIKHDVPSIMCSVVSDSFSIPWTVAHQAPLSMGFSRQNTGGGCHFLLQGTFPTQGWKLNLLHCRQILSHWAIGEASSMILGMGFS